MILGRKTAKILGLILLMGGLAACATAPATGKRIFTGGMSLADEKNIGAQEHPKILEQFGGVYEDEKLAAYVNRIGRDLARTSEMPDLGFTFTILNSDQVNAFALPGGYVYITRGLMALAGDEAELAGVIAHEIGHVTARHSAERYGDMLTAGLGAVLLDAGLGSGAANEVYGTIANLTLRGFSRQQEFEADSLGVRYLSRAGYADEAMASFLTRMRAHAALEAKISGKSPNQVDQFDFLATHPRPLERVRAAIAAARGNVPAGTKRGRVDYLASLDGLLFGDDPKEGFVRGQEFIHPELLFKFRVPPGFTLFNGRRAVIARDNANSVIRFDLKRNYTGPMTRYLTAVWGKRLRLSGVEGITVNGMQGATGATRIRRSYGPADLRLVAIRQSVQRIYRFMFITPVDRTSRLDPELRRTTFSMKPITRREAGSVKPLRIHIRAVGAGDTVEKFANLMAYTDLREERFRVLNGLEPGQPLRAGQLVKVVTEQRPRRAPAAGS